MPRLPHFFDGGFEILIALLLQEKKLVLKSRAVQELSHRVKNSLQTVVSLLRLQARRTDNEEARRILEDSLNRVFSISAAYELLAGAKEDRISLKEVLDMVRNNAVQSFVSPDFRPEICLEGDDMMVPSDIATSAALAVNELVQNALKYAFAGEQEGTVIAGSRQVRYILRSQSGITEKEFPERRKAPRAWA